MSYSTLSTASIILLGPIIISVFVFEFRPFRCRVRFFIKRSLPPQLWDYFCRYQPLHASRTGWITMALKYKCTPVSLWCILIVQNDLYLKANVESEHWCEKLETWHWNPYHPETTTTWIQNVSQRQKKCIFVLFFVTFRQYVSGCQCWIILSQERYGRW